MIVGIVLAAGESRRFGTDKRGLKLKNDEPMLMAAARKLKAHVDDLCVAVRQDDRAWAQRLSDAGIPVHLCAESHQGMGSTLAEVSRALLKAQHVPAGLMVALGDMPFIDDSSYAQLRHRLDDGESIVRPFYTGIPGHPVGFHGSWLRELSMLSDDEAARHLIQSNLDELCRLEVSDPGVIADIDTVEDLEAHFLKKEML